jgi:hypothetical protein
MLANAEHAPASMLATTERQALQTVTHSVLHKLPKSMYDNTWPQIVLATLKCCCSHEVAIGAGVVGAGVGGAGVVVGADVMWVWHCSENVAWIEANVLQVPTDTARTAERQKEHSVAHCDGVMLLKSTPTSTCPHKVPAAISRELLHSVGAGVGGAVGAGVAAAVGAGVSAGRVVVGVGCGAHSEHCAEKVA